MLYRGTGSDLYLVTDKRCTLVKKKKKKQVVCINMQISSDRNRNFCTEATAWLNLSWKKNVEKAHLRKYRIWFYSFIRRKSQLAPPWFGKWNLFFFSFFCTRISSRWRSGAGVTVDNAENLPGDKHFPFFSISTLQDPGLTGHCEAGQGPLTRPD